MRLNKLLLITAAIALFGANSFQAKNRRPLLGVNSTLSEVQETLSLYPEKTRKCSQVVTYEVFEKLIDRFASKHKRLACAGHWVNGVCPRKGVYDMDGSRSTPYSLYVHKKAGLDAVEIAFFGDLHGSAHSLTRSLVRLKDEKYLNNKFKIIKDNFYIVLVGDYIDDGVYGIETLYLIMRLKIANPERVCCIRGNHEDRCFTKELKEYISFRYEFSTKWPSITPAQEQKIYNFFGLLPIAVYFGLGDDTKMEYIQCCHGGIELGYCPKALFNDEKATFELITELKRATYAEQLSIDMQKSLHKNLPSKQLRDFVPTSAKKPVPNELTWAYFSTDPSMQTATETGFRSWLIGEALTREILNLAQTDTAHIRTIFRGHQHSMACKCRGYHSLWDDLVCTVFSMSKKLGYDSFVILSASKDKAEWQVTRKTNRF